MPLISLREYGRLKIGDFEPDRPSVNVVQAKVLTNLKRVHGFDAFKRFDDDTLCAQQYVGAVQIGTLTVEVLPKIEGVGDTTVRRNLVAMLAVAYDLDISEGDVAQVATQKQGILEILIRIFCDKLFSQVHRGLVRCYEAEEGNLYVLRGKLGIAEQVRRNAANPERLFCRFDEFQEDIPLNRVFKAAVRMLLQASLNLANQRRLSELLLVFSTVRDISRDALAWDRIAFDRMNSRYWPCFKLAKLFLKNTPPDVIGGRTQGFSLLFAMNDLFEEYIGRVAMKVFQNERCRVTLQSPQRHLAFDERTQRDVFAMKPDVVGHDIGGVVWIIDTKWKELSKAEAKEGVAQADLYQMYAYAHRYECRDVILLYPYHAALGAEAGVRARYRLKSWMGPERGDAGACIRIATVDLSDLKTVPAQLKDLFALRTTETRNWAAA